VPAPPTPPRWKTRGGDPGPGRRWQAALIVVLFFVAVTAAAFTGWWYARESPPHQGPIVLISADNLAADQLTPYRSGGPDTPAIAALATDGVVFDRAYAHSPQTLPSYVSILSGQLPFEHGVRDDVGFAMKDDARTLAELMRNRGFNTGAAVSTFLLRRESGVAQGFSFFDAELPEHGDGEAATTQRDSAHTIEAAERWMRMQDDQRYLLFVQVDDRSADEAVGRVVQELKDRDLYDDATIFLVGDHGDEQAVPPLADTSLRVPLIVKQPNSEGAGRRVVAPVQHIDLLPTILDLVRAPIPSGIRGRSLRSVLDDEDATVPEQPIYSEWLAARFRLGGHAIYGLTSGARRLIRGEHDELFDLQTGGRSLAVDTEEATRLRAALDRFVTSARIPEPSSIAPADEASFAALGYLPDLRLLSAAPVAIEPDVQAKLMELHRSAALLVAQNKYAQAIENLRSITRAHPELAVVHYQVGSLLLRTARYHEAAAAFGEAGRLQPDNVEIPIALAMTWMRARDYEQATRHADAAVTLADAYQPDARARAHTIAARVALMRFDADAATRHAAAAHEADAPLPLPQFVRGRLLFEEARYEDALRALEDALAAARENDRPIEDLHASLADTLTRLDRYGDAEMQYREELRLFPRSFRTYSSLAMLYRASNRDRDVEQVIGDLMAAAPTPEGYAIAARLWTVLGEGSRAEAVRADARTRFRGDPSLVLLEIEP
jgi:tetratricopeptide (TPR) repeat protein